MFATDTVPVIVHADGRYETTGDIVVTYAGKEFVVPAGHRTDLASVPTVVRSLMAVSGRVSLPAMVHDWCCDDLNARHRQGRTVDDTQPGGPFVGPVATDLMFRRMLHARDVPPVMRGLYWVGVRWGALFNPARRPGWVGTFLPVLLWSLVALPIVVWAAVGAAVSGVLYLVCETVVSLFPERRPCPDSAPKNSSKP